VGLLRMTEPEGSVLRTNEPVLNRWYSRDVTAIATHQALIAAPYFIDAEKGDLEQPLLPAQIGQVPVGGLTRISFYNSHLVYAVTWYGLALMIIGAGVIIVREDRRLKSD
jgi:surfeit locus 1 family protein